MKRTFFVLCLFALAASLACESPGNYQGSPQDAATANDGASTIGDAAADSETVDGTSDHSDTLDASGDSGSPNDGSHDDGTTDTSIDATADAQGDVDLGPECDGGVCPCTSDTDCTTGFCDLSGPSGVCVECLLAAHCTEPDASRCDDTGTCAACIDDADCLGVDARCSEGICTECTSATEDIDCLGKSCDAVTQTCTMTILGTRDLCETCRSNSECGTDLLCALHTYKQFSDYHCLPIIADGALMCAFAPFNEHTTALDIHGNMVDIREFGFGMRPEYCPAFLEVRTQKRCTVNADCLTGQCISFNGQPGICSHGCQTSESCFASPGLPGCSTTEFSCQNGVYEENAMRTGDFCGPV